jgi:two-component system, sensor histidine kinase FlrB
MVAMQALQIAGKTLDLPDSKTISRESIEELQKAFHTFTSMSEQLSDSYGVLEKRVVELSGELATLSEQRLQELNEKERLADQLESLLRLMPAAVIVIDNKGLITQINPTAEQWIRNALPDNDPQEILKQPWGRIVQQVFTPKQTDYHEVSLRDGRLVSLATSPLDNSGQLIMMTDQTETRQLQAKVARQERLTAMGQMVASLAHQIRTPLSAAMLYAANLKSPRLDQKVHHQFVDKLVGRLNHLEKQVQDMLLFVKGEIPLVNRLSTAKLMALLKEACGGFSQTQQQQIRWQIDCEDPVILCQADTLISAFMNLINNALEAFDNSDGQVSIQAMQRHQTIDFFFRDNGPGMSAEQVQKIQEPFFTTKSYGTGLGIPVVIATVKAHRGSLAVNSRPGAGTEFRISLPIFNER